MPNKGSDSGPAESNRTLEFCEEEKINDYLMDRVKKHFIDGKRRQASSSSSLDWVVYPTTPPAFPPNTSMHFYFEGMIRMQENSCPALIPQDNSIPAQQFLAALPVIQVGVPNDLCHVGGGFSLALRRAKPRSNVKNI